MTMLTNYAVNKTVDALFRAQTLGAPATLYHSLIVASQGYWVASTAYTSGQLVLPIGGNGHIYKCTTAGTTSSSAPTWPTTAGGTVTDGTVVWTEQTTAMLAGTFVEASYTGFARVAVTASLANYAGTQGAGTTVASSGSSGQTSNNNTITFGAPTSNQAGVVFGVLIADASSSGNIWAWSALNAPKTVNNGDAAPNFPAAAATFTFS